MYKKILSFFSIEKKIYFPKNIPLLQCLFKKYDTQFYMYIYNQRQNLKWKIDSHMNLFYISIT